LITIVEIYKVFGQFGNVLNVTFHDTPNKYGHVNGFAFVEILPYPGINILQQNLQIGECKLDLREQLGKDEAKAKVKEESLRKLFVGSLPKDLRDSTLYDYFSQFGVVQKAYVGRDIHDGRTRGFGFVIFLDKISVYRTLELKRHFIMNKEVFPKRVIPKKQMISDSLNYSERRVPKYLVKASNSNYNEQGDGIPMIKPRNSQNIKRKITEVHFDLVNCELDNPRFKTVISDTNMKPYGLGEYGQLIPKLDKRFRDVAAYYYLDKGLGFMQQPSAEIMWEDTLINTSEELIYYSDKQGLFGLIRAKLLKGFY